MLLLKPYLIPIVAHKSRKIWQHSQITLKTKLPEETVVFKSKIKKPVYRNFCSTSKYDKRCKSPLCTGSGKAHERHKADLRNIHELLLLISAPSTGPPEENIYRSPCALCAQLQIQTSPPDKTQISDKLKAVLRLQA